MADTIYGPPCNFKIIPIYLDHFTLTFKFYHYVVLYTIQSNQIKMQVYEWGNTGWVESKMGRISGKGFSFKWKRVGVMDGDSGDDGRYKLFLDEEW